MTSFLPSPKFWNGRATAERSLAKYFAEPLPDEEQEAWCMGNLEALQNANDLRADFTS